MSHYVPRNPMGSTTRKHKPGPARIYTDEERGDRSRQSALKAANKSRLAVRDIAGPEWQQAIAGINWERRNACERNLRLFNETYLRPIFYYGWSDDQLRCIRKTEVVFMDGGMFALAMPRGGGKTAICRSAMVWGTAFPHRRFPYLIGSTQPNADQSLNAIKTLWYRNRLLRDDFPEIAYPIYKLENRFHLARGQLFYGQPTHIEWGSDSIRYPCLLLPKEDAEPYLRNDDVRATLLGDAFRPTITHHPDYDAYVFASAGIFMATAGIDGSIRGEAEIHPITLEQPRPDIVLLDDVQKDQKAESPASCAKLKRLISGAVQGLAGPGRHIAALFPCTVIREGDVADELLDPAKHPEWQGERCKMVTSWPDGLTDYEISPDTDAGRLWQEYAELRKRSLALYEDIRLATEHYATHREVMDRGFTVSWADRYARDGKNPELSAQQHAMELRFKSPDSFPPEFQNEGRRLYSEGEMMITAPQLAERVTTVPRRHLPVDVQYLVISIDVQDEILFWTALGVAPDFTGIITDYGTWPPVPTRYFTKNQTQGWNLLSNGFFREFPQHIDKAIRTDSGRVRAPFEAKIYWAVGKCLAHVRSLEFIRDDEHQTVLTPHKIGIDTRWGQASEAIKRCIRDHGDNRILPYFGQAMPPSHRQFEEFTRTKGWLFEDQINPKCREVKWVLRPSPDGHIYMTADVWRLKDFLFARLGAPVGSPGSIMLFNATPEQHELYADHICRSEYPEPNTMRGMTKNQWLERPEGGVDNDWLDCTAGCVALASLCGAMLEHDRTGTYTRSSSVRSGRSISSRWKSRPRR